MDKFQDGLLRANRVARLDAILRLLRSNSQGLSDWKGPERAWLAELLVPAAEMPGGGYRLLPSESPDVTAFEGSIVVEVLLEMALHAEKLDVDQLRIEIQQLGKLHAKLDDPAASLDANEVREVERFVKQIRSYLAESVHTPAPPATGKREAKLAL